MNNTKTLFIKLGFLKISTQVIHIIYYVNLYFLGIYNTHCRILNTSYLRLDPIHCLFGIHLEWTPGDII